MSCANQKCWSCEREYPDDRERWCSFCFTTEMMRGAPYLDPWVEEELALPLTAEEKEDFERWEKKVGGSKQLVFNIVHDLHGKQRVSFN